MNVRIFTSTASGTVSAPTSKSMAHRALICAALAQGESRISGVDRITKAGDTLTYRRTFTLPRGFRGGHWLLHFGACDQVAQVCLNGRSLGLHEGGYLPFSFDVTADLRPGENELTVSVLDPLDHDYPWGKQRHNRGGMWYTPVSGIWQTVWLAMPRSPVRVRIMRSSRPHCRICL